LDNDACNNPTLVFQSVGHCGKTERQTKGTIDRQTDKEKDRSTERQRDRKAKRPETQRQKDWRKKKEIQETEI
jgi:hypothetical protein